jgi:RNA polymerase sigma factor (sigma-70 family)
MQMRKLTSDLDCLATLAAGEDRWPDFWKIYGGFIVSELRKLDVVSYAERDDFFQELATKLVSHDYIIIKRFLEGEAELTFLPLLRTIIRSIVIDDWRRNKLWQGVALQSHWDDGQGFGAATGDDPADEHYKRTRLICIFEGISRTSADKHAFQVLQLRYIDDLPVKKIAKQIGISPNAVSQRLRVYHRRLRETHSLQLSEMLND